MAPPLTHLLKRPKNKGEHLKHRNIGGRSLPPWYSRMRPEKWKRTAGVCGTLKKFVTWSSSTKKKSSNVPQPLWTTTPLYTYAWGLMCISAKNGFLKRKVSFFAFRNKYEKRPFSLQKPNLFLNQGQRSILRVRECHNRFIKLPLEGSFLEKTFDPKKVTFLGHSV